MSHMTQNSLSEDFFQSVFCLIMKTMNPTQYKQATHRKNDLITNINTNF